MKTQVALTTLVLCCFGTALQLHLADASSAVGESSSTAAYAHSGPEWRRAARASGKPFTARPPELDPSSSQPGADPRTWTDPRTGHIHHEHTEWRMTAAGKRSHLRYTAVQTRAVLNVDREAAVAALHCALAPDYLTLFVPDGVEARGGGGHAHAKKLLRPDMVVVGGEHWDCGRGPAVAEEEEEREGPSAGERPAASVTTGFMLMVLEVAVHPCSAEVAEKYGGGSSVLRGTCIDALTERAVLTDVFRDVDVLYVDEDLGNPHVGSRRVPEHVYKRRGPVRGHDFGGPAEEKVHSIPFKADEAGPDGKPRPFTGYAYARHGERPAAAPAPASSRADEVAAAEAHTHRRKTLDFWSDIGAAFTGPVANFFKSAAKAVESVAETVAKGARAGLKVVTDGVKAGIKLVKQGVSEVASFAKKAVKVVLEAPLNGLKELNGLTGGRLGFLVEGVEQATNLVEYGVLDAINTIEAAANQMLDFAELITEAASCLTGDCELTFRKPSYGVSYNFDEYFHRQYKKLEPFKLTFAVSAAKSLAKGNNNPDPASVTLDLYGTVSFDPKEIYAWFGTGFKFQLRVKNYNVELVALTKYLGVKASAQLLIQLSVTVQLGVVKPLFRQEWSKDFFVGPVLVSVTPQLIVSIGGYGDLAINWTQNVGARLEAGLEVGAKLEQGQLQPIAGWMDGKPPVLQVPEFVAPDNIYMNMVLMIVPEFAVDLGVYKIMFLNFQIQLYVKLGFVWTAKGTSAGSESTCEGTSNMWFGLIPYVAANLKLEGLIKLPDDKSLSYKIIGHYFDRNSPIWKPTVAGTNQYLDQIILNTPRACEGPAASAPAAVDSAVDLSVVSRTSSSVELGWYYVPSRAMSDEVVGFKVEYGIVGGNTKSTAHYGTGTSPVRFLTYSSQKLDPASVVSKTSLKVNAAACPKGAGLVLAFDVDSKIGACLPLADFTPSEDAPAFKATVAASGLRSAFSAVLSNLGPDAQYEFTVYATLINGEFAEAGSVKVYTNPPPAPAPSGLQMAEILADDQNAGRFAARLQWTPNGAVPRTAFYQVLVRMARLAMAVPSPCPAGYRRVPYLAPTAPCEEIQGFVAPLNAATAISPPVQSGPFLDYIPTASGAQTSLLVRGLSAGLVYSFEVQHVVQSTREAGDFFPGTPSAALQLQMPGLPDAGFANGNTSLPYQLKVARLGCGTFNVSFVPAAAGFGGAVAALAKRAVLKITDNIGTAPKYLTIDVLPRQAQYSVFINVTSAAVKRTLRRSFVLNAVTSAGFNPDAEASNLATVLDRPCQSVPCALARLDDIFIECPDPGLALTTLDPAAQGCPYNDTVLDGMFCTLGAADPAPIARRRLHSLPAAAAAAPGLPYGRRLLQVNSNLFSDSPPAAAGADAGFRIAPGQELPVDPTLALAANAAPKPTDPTAIELPAAGQFRAAGYYLPPTYPADSLLARMQADVNRATLATAALPKRGPKTVVSGLDVDFSKSACPPDFKLPAALGRTQLPSLCPYRVAGVTKVCGASATHAVQLLFTAPRAGVFAFDASASAFPTILDLRGNGSCDPIACTRPFVYGAGGLAARRATAASWYLAEGATVAVNLAAAAGGCASGALVLDVSLDMPYDEHVVVDGTLLNETVPAGLPPLSGSGPPPPPAFLASVEAAVAYAARRIAARTAARPVQVGVYLRAGQYARNATSWLPPQTAAGAGSTIVLRSLSGLTGGPASALDTVVACTSPAAAWSLDPDAASPLLLPMGLSIAPSCAGNFTDGSGAARSVPALTVRGLSGLLLRSLVFSNAANPAGSGGALAVVGGASVTVSGCVFFANRAGVRGGGMAVLDGGAARVVNSTFDGNAAPVGGAAVVGSEAAAAGTVSFEDCVFRRNEARAATAAASDGAARYGGALALLRSSATVTIAGGDFALNAADGAAAVHAATPAAIARARLRQNLGAGAVLASGTALTLDQAVFRQNYNLLDRSAGGALTCAGAAATVTARLSAFKENFAVAVGGGVLVRSGCVADFTECSFEQNKALTGAGAAVGLLGDRAADAGGASFARCAFAGNGANALLPSEAGFAGAGVGQGGGLGVFGSSAVVAISESLFANNTAFMGGGLFASDAVAIGGPQSIFSNNAAGYVWFDGDAERASQIGGGVMIAPAAGKAARPFEVGAALLLQNVARGYFGGGMAVVGPSTVLALRGTLFLSNEVLMEGGQAGGLYVAETMPAAGSDFRATANSAPGAFQNVLFGAELSGIAASYDALRGNGTNSAAFRSCYQCSPCQTCQARTGRCAFPADLEAWCKYTGACNKEACSFVTIGDAKFDESRGFTSLTISFDFPYAVDAPSAALNCSALFAPDSAKALGAGASCRIAGAAGRGLRATSTQQVTVTLGGGFTAGPGTTLALLASGLPAQYGSLSDNPVVQIALSSVPLAVAQAALQSANYTASLQAAAAATAARPASSSSARPANDGPFAALLAALLVAAALLAAV